MPLVQLSEITDRAAGVARDVIAPDAAGVDREGRWPERGLRALQRVLGGLVVPEANGGLGHGLLALARVSEELGAVCPSTALCFGMHCVATAVVAAKATPDQRARYLEPIAQGRHLTTLALSEPGTGAHFYLPQARLAADAASGGFRLSGTKCFVTSGSLADSYVVSTMAAAQDAPPGQFSCVVVPANAPGLRWTDRWDGLGMRGNSSRTVVLEDVAVPRADLVGREGDQIWYVFHVVAPYFLVAMAGTYLGLAAGALAEACEHLRRRHHAHTGGALGQLAVLQHRIGCLWAQVERTRQLVYHAATLGDLGAEGALPALCAAKAEVADCAVAIANEAMTLAGGLAYREGASLQQRLRDARAAHVMSPTTDLLRLWTGRAVLGLPLLGD